MYLNRFFCIRAWGVIFLSIIFLLLLNCSIQPVNDNLSEKNALVDNMIKPAIVNQDRYFKFVNRASGKNMDNMGATVNGTNVCQYANSSSNNQQWKIQDLGTGYFKIICRTGGLCLDSMGRTTNGSIAGQWADNTSYNQQWQIVQSGNYYKIISRANGKCLDTGGLTANGDALQMWGSGSSSNQLWQIVDVSTMYSAYLLTYFSSSTSAVYFAYSLDALHWTALNNNSPVLYSTIGTKNIRDPFIIRGNDGVFHLLGTDNWSSRSIIIFDSTDLINWTGQRLCEIAPVGATFAWAPEAMYDSSTGSYRIYFASNPNQIHKMYTVTTSDFKTFSSASLFFDPGNGLYAIDGTIMPYNNMFYMFYKYSDPGPVGKGIQRVQSTGLAGPWSYNSGPLTDLDVEGPTIFKDNLWNTWYLYYDYFLNGYWGCSKTNNVSNTWTKLANSSISLPSGVRHGNIISITAQELSRMDAKW